MMSERPWYSDFSVGEERGVRGQEEGVEGEGVEKVEWMGERVGCGRR